LSAEGDDDISYDQIVTLAASREGVDYTVHVLALELSLAFKG
jgi:hypothetical protein